MNHPHHPVAAARILSFTVAQELNQDEIDRISGAARRGVLTPVWAETGEITYEVDA